MSNRGQRGEVVILLIFAMIVLVPILILNAVKEMIIELEQIEQHDQSSHISRLEDRIQQQEDELNKLRKQLNIRIVNELEKNKAVVESEENENDFSETQRDRETSGRNHIRDSGEE